MLADVKRPYFLIRYMNERSYVRDFMTGKLFMNYLGYFWDKSNGFSEQNDMYEGVACTASAWDIFPDDFARNASCDPRFRAEGYCYCNVACFYRVDMSVSRLNDKYLLVDWQSSENMQKFGKFAVIILDTAEFLRRVGVAADRENFKYLGGNVVYHEVKKDGLATPSGWQCHVYVDTPFDLRHIPYNASAERNLDSFDKSIEYVGQKEWRISLYRGIKSGEPIVLEAGDMHDIARWTKTETLVETVEALLRQGKIKPEYNYGYRGNTDRETMRELFYALGDNKATPFIILGTPPATIA